MYLNILCTMIQALYCVAVDCLVMRIIKFLGNSYYQIVSKRIRFSFGPVYFSECHC